MNTYKNTNADPKFCITWTNDDDLTMGVLDPELVITTGEDNLEIFDTKELMAARWLEVSGVAWVDQDEILNSNLESPRQNP